VVYVAAHRSSRLRSKLDKRSGAHTGTTLAKRRSFTSRSVRRSPRTLLRISLFERWGFNASFSLSDEFRSDSALFPIRLLERRPQKSCRFSHLFTAVFVPLPISATLRSQLFRAASTCCKDRGIVRGS
jgi:hypothetical protein